MRIITALDVRLYHIPLAEVLVEAKHEDHHFFELITVAFQLPDGSEGSGYT